ncbi:hypothetical protein [Brucella intermedia]|uniref:hypothetical protein n=1 Tax=Brucella intermedia TaxID=94625 RepID=UPI00124DE322|nr:hypothetical protein [Brucella intermedia]KAB2708335.1 hypothetical protein F9K80_14680 [Brucella intermedia]
MTVPVPDQLEYISDADGVTKDFPYPKRFLQKDEIVVLLRDADGVDTPQILNTHYTIAGSSWPSGGTISFITAPQAPNKVVRYRMTQAKQTVDLENNQRNDAPSVETQLDRLTMAIQDRGDVLSDLFLRSVKVPFGYSGSTVLPWPDPNKLLGWNENGDGFANKEILTVGDLVVGAAGKEVIGKDTVEGIRDFLDIKDPIEKLFDTASLVETVEIDSEVNSIRTAGFSTAGDGGAALYKRVTAEPSHIGKIQSADGAWWEIVDRVLRPEMFGVKGDGSDETALLQGMFDFSAWKDLILTKGKNYGFTSLTLPEGINLRAKGSTFTKLVASASYGITINAYTMFDEIILDTPGSLAADRGVNIVGSNIYGDHIQSVAATEANGFAISLNGNAVASLSHIRIGKLTTGNFSSQIQNFYVRRCRIDEIQMTNYVTGLYLRDANRCSYGKIFASGAHSLETGGPGNNGVLMESITNDYATNDVTFDDVTIRDSAEHGFRIGGDKIMRSIYVKALKVFNAGSLPGVSTGGAAFKALLNNANPGRHQDIRVDSLYFEDCGTNNGFGNHSAINIGRCQDVIVMNPVGRKRDKAWSCIQGLTVNGGNRVKIVNPDIRDCNYVICDFGVNPDPIPLEGNVDVIVDGGILHTNATGTLACWFHGSGGTTSNLDAPFNNVSLINKVKVIGGLGLARYTDITGSGAYSNMMLDAEYTAPAAAPASGIWQAVPASLDNNLTVRLITDIASPVSSRARNGSTWISTGDGAFKVRKAGAWSSL